MTTWTMFNFQDAASPIMEQLIFFHDHAMMILIMIMTSILYLMMNLIKNKFINKNLLNQQNLEIIWTIIPMIILIFIAIPSIHLLYLNDEINYPLLTIKIMGHQWYWSYEYTDFKNIEFDSYMNQMISFNLNSFRLLDVDNNMIIPMNTKMRILVSSTDVIHSWTIPSLGKKIDAIPGRLNQLSLMIKRPGIFFGQCSEICGTNHSFMPITIESTSMNLFLKWINSF
uniref:Cytochrome c oxidase subunit 2 n=1 Tax=Cladiucha punctata TaxID=2669317 RepID=A0A8F4YKI7_9HYME|nr:cytochrome c oxidase subunit II [Cladiucha punctata]YP_010363326.1 cytochrome c oxidase subunit II [Cladiucha huangbki]QXG15715.1 cytochrome c oxidase subunit II [Cladiucha punctata]UJM44055.1 cytochrome c oxidase subunit II [Cladiucha huangbki]